MNEHTNEYMKEYMTKIKITETSVNEIHSLTSSGNEELFCLFWAKDGDDLCLKFLSRDKSIRALEFMDYFVSDYAMVKGDEKIAHAQLSKIFLQVLMSELELTDIATFLQKKTELYFINCTWIYGDTFITEHKNQMEDFPLYAKRKIPWAYVKTTDIVKAGEKFKLKSLENESNIVITASEDSYIMIGCLGEIYNIQGTKFVQTYETSDEKLDAYEQMLCYLPEVQSYEDDSYISLEEFARLCYPKEASCIYAIPLKQRTKVFTTHNKGEYFVGRSGDYLAIRQDDLTDLYIIQKEIFHKTYIRATE